jgi:hypothetical protein
MVLSCSELKMVKSSYVWPKRNNTRVSNATHSVLPHLYLLVSTYSALKYNKCEMC